MDIVWETPPDPDRPGRRANPEELQLADALTQQPHKWARILTYDADPTGRLGRLASNINTGKRKAFIEREDGRFRAVARRPETEQPESTVRALYVKFVPNVPETQNRG